MLIGNSDDLQRAAAAGEKRIDDVLRAFDSEAKETPRERFAVVTSSLNAAAANSSGFLCAVIFIKQAAKAHYKGDPILIWVIMIAIVVGVIIFANASAGKRQAIVRGDSITIKNRSYSCGQIDCLKGFDMSHVALYSEGKRILKVLMTDNNCDELVKWAKANGIYTEHIFTDDGTSKQKKIILTVTAIVIVVAVAVPVIYFGLR